MSHPTSDFPILDSPRTRVAMPVRLIHSSCAGFCIEIGPYSINRPDIERLRAAIESYDQATGRPAR
jgi:hypothetical protein